MMKVEALKVFVRFFRVLLDQVILLFIVQNELREPGKVDGFVVVRVQGEIRLSARFGIVFPCVGEFLRLYLLLVRDACAVRRIGGKKMGKKKKH